MQLPESALFSCNWISKRRRQNQLPVYGSLNSRQALLVINWRHIVSVGCAAANFPSMEEYYRNKRGTNKMKGRQTSWTFCWRGEPLDAFESVGCTRNTNSSGKGATNALNHPGISVCFLSSDSLPLCQRDVMEWPRLSCFLFLLFFVLGTHCANAVPMVAYKVGNQLRYSPSKLFNSYKFY